MTLRKERILFFIETGGPGGAERVVLELLQGFKNLGHEVFLSSLRTGWLTETAIASGFPYYQIRSSRRLDVSLPFRISQLLKMLEIDVLHTHLLDSNFYGALASRLVTVRHIGTEHGDVHHIDAKKHVKLKLRIASGGHSILTAVSEYSAKKLLLLGVRPEKAVVVPNPVREPTPISEENRRVQRRELGITNDSTWLWFHVGNLRPVKDQETLVKGFAESIRTGSENQHLVIIGSGPDGKRLEELSGQLGIRAKISFLGHRDDVDKLLRAGDGFILSSVSESMPMALLEAISHGLYPICSAVGGIGEIVPSSQMFPAKDFKKLSELCSQTVNDPQHALGAAVQLRRRVLVERGTDQVLAKYLELYRRN